MCDVNVKSLLARERQIDIKKQVRQTKRQTDTNRKTDINSADTQTETLRNVQSVLLNSLYLGELQSSSLSQLQYTSKESFNAYKLNTELINFFPTYLNTLHFNTKVFSFLPIRAKDHSILISSALSYALSFFPTHLNTLHLLTVKIINRQLIN